MYEWLENLAIKFLFKRGNFTKLRAKTGRYYEDGFDVKNGTDHNYYIIAVRGEAEGE